ncbi:MAG: type II toxin-antitoxin system VapC family toxin [Chloroflexota bacterium]|nr:type II toxin-antitoxin system VapC family toxin [Chloroflexota bacterium]
MEPGGEEARSSAESADLLSASRIAYAECRAAIARAGQRMSRSEALYGRQTFERIWAEMAIIELDAALSVVAGDLAERHALRGMDAIHLASALWMRDAAERALVFAAWDDRLRAAARGEGLALLPG